LRERRCRVAVRSGAVLGAVLRKSDGAGGGREAQERRGWRRVRGERAAHEGAGGCVRNAKAVWHCAHFAQIAYNTRALFVCICFDVGR